MTIEWVGRRTAPTQPYLPPAQVRHLPGRGETFVRVGPHRPGAPTVALLHGWLATADLNWFALYEPLCRTANVVAIDHRGHGRGLRSHGPFTFEDAADDLAAVLDQLDTGPVIACGYSMGGPIALHLAHRRPDLVRGLVMTATALEFRSHLLDRLQWNMMALVSVALRFGADTWSAARVIEVLAATDPVVAAWREHLLAETKRVNTSDAVAAGRALSAYDARPFAPALGMRSVVVVTTGDKLVDPDRQHELADALAATTITLDADHDVFLRRPALWADAICQAIDLVDRPVGTPALTAVPTGPRAGGPEDPGAASGGREAGAVRRRWRRAGSWWRARRVPA